jgi:hypothetical protein
MPTRGFLHRHPGTLAPDFIFSGVPGCPSIAASGRRIPRTFFYQLQEVRMARKPDIDGDSLYPTWRIPLASVSDCRKELSRLFRLSLKGRIKPVDLARYGRTLGEISRLIEVEKLEVQLSELESLIEEGGIEKWRGQTGLKGSPGRPRH